jgi:hypothetical protein
MLLLLLLQQRLVMQWVWTQLQAGQLQPLHPASPDHLHPACER